MRLKVPLYVVSIVLAILGFPLLLVLIYLDLIDSGITTRFFWAVGVACCIFSILAFSLARILSVWEEEDGQE